MYVLRKTHFSGVINKLSSIKSKIYCSFLPKNVNKYFCQDFKASCKAYANNNKYVSSFTDIHSNHTDILYVVIESNDNTVTSFYAIYDMKEMKEKQIDINKIIKKSDDFSLTMIKLYNIHLYNIKRLIKKEKNNAKNH